MQFDPTSTEDDADRQVTRASESDDPVVIEDIHRVQARLAAIKTRAQAFNPARSDRAIAKEDWGPAAQRLSMALGPVMAAMRRAPAAPGSAGATSAPIPGPPPWAASST